MAAHAQANEILKDANAEDLFEDVTVNGSPTLRHRQSGVVCTFQYASPLNKVMVLDQPRGSSIGCNTGLGLRSYSLFIDRVPGTKPPIDQVAAMISTQIKKRLPDATPAPTLMAASGKDDRGADLPPHKVIVLMRPTPQGDFEEREALGYVGDWLIQQRITEPAASSMGADLLNELSFMAYQREILKGPKTASVNLGDPQK